MLAAGVGLAQPRFEVASVKPGPPGVERASMDGGPLPAGPFNLGGYDPGRITWTNMGLMRMLQVAYDLPAARISAPDWMETERYNIVATMPMGTSVADFRLMVRSLLADRFKLAVHRAAKDVSGYGLEVARGGVKIKDSIADAKGESRADSSCQGCNALVVMDASGFPAPRPGNPLYPPGAGFEDTFNVNGTYRATVLNHSMAGVAAFLGNILGSPVEDRTGLAGIYSFHLEYVPAAATDPGADVLDAVQRQLGLRLVSGKVPVETLVIDHAEKVPTEN
jgi:uncharacterized protein (TIGR03435 family)